MMIPSLLLSAVGFFTIGTESSGLSTLVRPDGEPMYLSGAEHLFKQQAHEFANTNWETEVVANLKAWNFTSLEECGQLMQQIVISCPKWRASFRATNRIILI